MQTEEHKNSFVAFHIILLIFQSKIPPYLDIGLSLSYLIHLRVIFLLLQRLIIVNRSKIEIINNQTVSKGTLCEDTYNDC